MSSTLEPTQKELIVLVGVSGSGKTHLANWLSQQQGWIAITEESAGRAPVSRLLGKAELALQAGNRVVVDTSCNGADKRRAWVWAARRAEATPICLFLNPKPEVCAQRLAGVSKEQIWLAGLRKWSVKDLQRAAAVDKNGDKEGFRAWVTAKNQEVVNDFLRKRGFQNADLNVAFGNPHNPCNSNPKKLKRKRREAEQQKEAERQREEQMARTKRQRCGTTFMESTCLLDAPEALSGAIKALHATRQHLEAGDYESEASRMGGPAKASCHVHVGIGMVKRKAGGQEAG